MYTAMSFNKVTANESFEGFEVLPLPLSTQEESFLARAQHASSFDSKQKVTFAVTLMKGPGFATMDPQKMGRIFEAFRFTLEEKMNLDMQIFFTGSLNTCLAVLQKASLFKPEDFTQVNIEEDSKLVRTVNIISSFISSSIDTIFSAPFILAFKLIMGGKK